MQQTLIIQSNGSGKDTLEDYLKDGWTVVSTNANNGQSYNDFVIVVDDGK